MIDPHPTPSFAEIKGGIDGALKSLNEGDAARARLELQRLLALLASDKSALIQAPPDGATGPFGRLT